MVRSRRAPARKCVRDARSLAGCAQQLWFVSLVERGRYGSFAAVVDRASRSGERLEQEVGRTGLPAQREVPLGAAREVRLVHGRQAVGSYALRGAMAAADRSPGPRRRTCSVAGRSFSCGPERAEMDASGL